MAPFWSTSFVAALGLVAAQAPPPAPQLDANQLAALAQLAPQLAQQAQKQPAPAPPANAEPGIWPNATIPFYVSDELLWVKDNIKEKQKEWEKHTCINFVHKTDKHDTWLHWIITREGEGKKCEGVHGYPGSGKGALAITVTLPNIGNNLLSPWKFRGCGKGDKILRAVRTAIGPGHGESTSWGEEVTHKDYEAVNKAYKCPNH